MIERALAVHERRHFRVPREAVFRAFIDAEAVSRWFSPSPDIPVDVCAYDFRKGGRYRFGYPEPDGSFVFVVGTFVTIAPPEKLVFTWTWEAPAPHADVETLVTIEIVARGGESELLLIHERFPTQDACDRHSEGWATTLDRLSLAVEQAGKKS